MIIYHERDKMCIRDRALRERTFKREVLDEVVRLKSKSLENYLIFYSSPETVKQFWKAFRDLPFQEYTYGQFIAKVREKFGVDIEDFLREWYESSSLPLFACLLYTSPAPWFKPYNGF